MKEDSMKKLLTISKDPRIKVSSKIETYLFPQYVYIKVEENTNFMIKKKQVKKGEKLFKRENKEVLSPVSGYVEGIISKKTENNTDYYLKIQNDYEEEDSYSGVQEFSTKALKIKFSEVLKEIGMDITKYKNKQRLILNGIEDEPYLATKATLHKTYAKEILSTLDLLSDTFSISKIEIYLKENDRESIEVLSSEMGTYPNMTLEILPDFYPIGDNKILSKYLHLNEECVLVQTEEILNIYEEGVRKRIKDLTFVTFTGDAIKNPMVVKVKIGSSLNEVIKELIDLKKGPYEIILNGLMKGRKIQEDYIIDESTRAIYFMKQRNDIEKPCIACGKCIDVCPFHCNPYRAYLTNSQVVDEKCMSCGLCTFICPSYIKLENYIKGDRR